MTDYSLLGFRQGTIHSFLFKKGFRKYKVLKTFVTRYLEKSVDQVQSLSVESLCDK